MALDEKHQAKELAAPPAAVATEPRIYGVIDVLRPERIAGWAIDRADSAAALEIDIYREGCLVATVRADRYRADLEKGGVGTGKYGFAAALTPPIEPGFGFTLEAVARAADEASGGLKRVGAAAEPVSPEHRVLERVFEEVLRLRGAEAASRRATTGSEAEARGERLDRALERIEVAQARIEAALATVETPAPRDSGGLGAIAICALAVALGSLGLGIYSMLHP
jgi:hypothetical protein